MEGTNERRTAFKGFDALNLKLLAMALMLCDHIWYVFLRDAGPDWMNWMTWIGRLAFPIFAFQIAEGFVHTHSFKRYWGRVFLFALISEIPFNLMTNGSVLNPNDQNVMFTFCIALLLLALMERARKKGRTVFFLSAFGCAAAGYVLGYVLQVDYYGEGILTVMLFYLCREKRYGRLAQLAGLFLIHAILHGQQVHTWFYLSANVYVPQLSDWRRLGGYEFPLPGPGWEWKLTGQGFALLALIPIWLYNGKQGRHSRALQYACYAFYPAHLLIVGLLGKVF